MASPNMPLGVVTPRAWWPDFAKRTFSRDKSRQVSFHFEGRKERRAQEQLTRRWHKFLAKQARAYFSSGEIYYLTDLGILLFDFDFLDEDQQWEVAKVCAKLPGANTRDAQQRMAFLGEHAEDLLDLIESMEEE